MIISSWNVNGIRACVKKGSFFEYLESKDPDILFLQEIKALESDLPENVRQPAGYHAEWFPAEKKGYSGVGVLTKEKPIAIHKGFGIPEYDREGRVIVVEYDTFYALGVYFPNGQMSPERMAYKLTFYKALFDYCEELKATGKHVLIAGDYNTAHTAIDLARPKENEGISGFTPIEREWMDRIIGEYGYRDTFRAFNSEPKEYSWWTYRAGARQRNVGWRIDYVFVSEALLPQVSNAFIQQDVMGSDHCPVGVQLNLS